MRRLHREMPGVMQQLNRLEFDYADGKGMDFEPYTEFLSEDETRNWIRAWTGNASFIWQPEWPTLTETTDQAGHNGNQTNCERADRPAF